MTDEQALLAAIADQPDEDTPRLAFADWLDETGGEANVARAAFIRLQVRLAHFDGTDAEREELRRAEADLWVPHRRAWRANIPDVPGINWRGYDRGFLTVLDADQMDLFVRHAAALFAAAPVRGVRILRAAPNMTRELAALPDLIRLRELDLTGCRALTDADAALLARSPGVANLRVLRLGANRLGVDGLRVLAYSPHLKALRRLDIGWRDFTAETLRELEHALPGVTIG